MAKFTRCIPNIRCSSFSIYRNMDIKTTRPLHLSGSHNKYKTYQSFKEVTIYQLAKIKIFIRKSTMNQSITTTQFKHRPT
jgi:hypothetical protein